MKQPPGMLKKPDLVSVTWNQPTDPTSQTFLGLIFRELILMKSKLTPQMDQASEFLKKECVYKKNSPQSFFHNILWGKSYILHAYEILSDRTVET